MARLIPPEYGRRTLAEVLPAVAAHLSPELGAQDVLGLPPASRYVLVMVDGLGHQLLSRDRARAPYLSGLLDDALVLTTAVPSTTATSLTTLGTGCVPGQHGIVGYSFRALGEVINALTWDDRLDPLTFQPQPTWLQRMSEAGITVSTVSLADFEGSGLTGAALRGPTFVRLDDELDDDARVNRVVAASRAGQRSLVYAYERRLDHTGHGKGCGSEDWRAVLDGTDAWLEQLRNALDPATVLLITGDHGMVDVPSEHQLVIEDTPGLASGLDLIGGEGRFRQLYTERPDEVAARWRRRLGERAVVRLREEAIEDGWFGEVADRMAPRIGDVVVALQGTWALMTLSKPGEFTLVGQHGSLTAEEMCVPLLVDSFD
ncbi:MAG: alkaline phosphatase family protein [Brooklawnia sp.]|uniref:alkaline phosphatase family protein n=1 Tax=Brooklawnia sp. TaxID=2699740 RepID=UPI003C783BD6